MTENPSQVDSIQDFLCLKCPECNFDSKEDDVFEEHAIENHPLSFVIFGKVCKEEELDPTLTIEGHLPDIENYDHKDILKEEKQDIVDPIAPGPDELGQLQKSTSLNNLFSAWDQMPPCYKPPHPSKLPIESDVTWFSKLRFDDNSTSHMEHLNILLLFFPWWGLGFLPP